MQERHYRLAPQILHPGIVPAERGIVGIGLAGIGLPLERNVAIGLQRVAAQAQTDNPLQEIPDKEKKEKHFPLLEAVDVFVTNGLFAKGTILFADENQPAKIDGPKASEGEMLVIDDAHGAMGTFEENRSI